LGVAQDFFSSGSLRYTHRDLGRTDIYFVANPTDRMVRENCVFRADRGKPELWDPLTGETRPLPEFTRKEGLTTIPMSFDVYQSFFVVFPESSTLDNTGAMSAQNFPEKIPAMELEGSWEVSFDPEWGGPEQVTFEGLVDWTTRPEKGIRYYSGTASYQKSFDLSASVDLDGSTRIYLHLGEVNVMARVLLNSQDLGVVWTAPWQVDITDAVKANGNLLEIEVVNLWPNRLIGDEFLPEDGIRDGRWPAWLLDGKPRTSGRYTFTTHPFYTKDSPLLAAGLTGPVTILTIR
jgi:hypothetical protein